MPIIPSVSMCPKGEEICNMEEVAEFLVYIISMAEPDGDKWSELEASLGRLDSDVVFDIHPKESCHPDYNGTVFCHLIGQYFLAKRHEI